MAFSPSFGGYALESANGVALESVQDAGPITVKTSDTVGYGSGIANVKLGGRVIKATVAVTASDSSTLQTRLDDVLEAIHITGTAELRLTTSRYIDAYCSTGSIKLVGGTSGLMARFPVTWVAEDPYWRTQAQTIVTIDDTGSAPSETVTNNGTAPELPSFQFVNSSGGLLSGTLSMKNSTTGMEFRLHNLQVGSGDTLNINGLTGEVYFNTGASTDARTPTRVDGAFWELDPGANTVVYDFTWGASSNFPAKVLAYSRYHHLGDWG